GSSDVCSPDLLAHVGGELEPLALTAGERGQGLTDRQVAQAHVLHAPQQPRRSRHGGALGGEQLAGCGDGEGEHLGDVPAAEGVLEHVGAEAPALALLARGLDGLHEPELGVDDPGAPAHRAGPFGVVREQGGLDPLALANALRMCSSRPVYVAGVERREPRSGAWSATVWPASSGTEEGTAELLREPA